MSAYRQETPSEGGYKAVARAAELEQILEALLPQVVDFVKHSETDRRSEGDNEPQVENLISETLSYYDSISPKDLEEKLKDTLVLREEGGQNEGLQALVGTILKHSVRTSAAGFLDKLYGAPLPPGIAAELVLGALNTNLHVYKVSPVLTLIEKTTARQMARMFGLQGPRAGGISVQGGSASNMTSIVIARNTLFPETKSHGNGAVSGRLLLYASAHGHYSIEKAAQALGFGSQNVVPVPTDNLGRMNVESLSAQIEEAKRQGDVPFYISATAGTTVLGSFDPFQSIAAIARKHNLWFHVDAAWGGGFVFSKKPENLQKLQGVEYADSIATNPHKMLGVPVTCSFLLGKDMKLFQAANTLKAGYLFHNDEETDADDDMTHMPIVSNGDTNGQHLEDDSAFDVAHWKEPYDLADLTLQCGRRGDSLKFFLSWNYYGTLGYSRMVDDAYDNACFMMHLVKTCPDLTPVLHEDIPPSCLQVCFYFTPGRQFVYGLLNDKGQSDGTCPPSVIDSETTRRAKVGRKNSMITTRMVRLLLSRGFMTDFAPALEGQEDRGSFFRVVINITTARRTVQHLVTELLVVGRSVVSGLET